MINVESEEKILSVWYPNDQTLEAVWKVFSGEATSSSRLDFNAYASSTMPGLFSCRSVLQLPTPKQSADPSQKTNNCGRVILIGTNISARLPGWVPALIQQIKQPPQAAGYDVFLIYSSQISVVIFLSNEVIWSLWTLIQLCQWMLS